MFKFLLYLFLAYLLWWLVIHPLLSGLRQQTPQQAVPRPRNSHNSTTHKSPKPRFDDGEIEGAYIEYEEIPPKA